MKIQREFLKELKKNGVSLNSFFNFVVFDEDLKMNKDPVEYDRVLMKMMGCYTALQSAKKRFNNDVLLHLMKKHPS